MSPAWGHATGVLILLMMAAFLGIWVWAWLPYHQRSFNTLARLPMEDQAVSPGEPIPATDEEQRR